MGCMNQTVGTPFRRIVGIIRGVTLRVDLSVIALMVFDEAHHLAVRPEHQLRTAPQLR